MCGFLFPSPTNPYESLKTREALPSHDAALYFSTQLGASKKMSGDDVCLYHSGNVMIPLTCPPQVSEMLAAQKRDYTPHSHTHSRHMQLYLLNLKLVEPWPLHSWIGIQVIKRIYHTEIQMWEWSHCTQEIAFSPQAGDWVPVSLLNFCLFCLTF